jgi:RNA polymerase sigma-70 factor (ECF subfamily)
MPNEQRELIERWQRGEEEAVRQLFLMCHPRAVRIGVLSGLRLDEAQDCAQDTFIHAFERRAQLRDPHAFPLWFHRMLTRRILDNLGAKMRRCEEPLGEDDEEAEAGDWTRHEPPRPESLALEAELREEVWEVVQALPTQYRVPLVLRYYGDFSIHEVAELLGAREGTVRVQLHRALWRLRRQMTGHPAHDDRAPAEASAASRDPK